MPHVGSLFALALGVAHGLVIGPVPTAAPEHACAAQRSGGAVGRREVLLSSCAALTVLAPGAALANTQPMLDKPMESFEKDELRRAEFQKKQKVFKKAWRKELANLEFSSNDAEANAAIDSLKKLIYVNGNEIPEGVRKMDLDQVYRTVQGKLQKDTRMNFLTLDAMVQQVCRSHCVPGLLALPGSRGVMRADCRSLNAPPDRDCQADG